MEIIGYLIIGMILTIIAFMLLLIIVSNYIKQDIKAKENKK